MEQRKKAFGLYAWAGWLLFAFCSNVAWSAVGYVHEASGDVRIQVGSAPARPIKTGEPIAGLIITWSNWDSTHR